MSEHSNALIHEMQLVLKQKRFFTGAVDGTPSPAFDNAISEFKASVGFVKRPYFTGATLLKLDVIPGLFERHPAPWMNEMSRYLGMHEVRNNRDLLAWLKSDGKTLGDPAKLPWCGDAVETAIKLTLGTDMFDKNGDSNLTANPYWALNWLKFGYETLYTPRPFYGAVAVFERSGGGHVGFVAGFDRTRMRLLIRGGNQSDTVSDSWMDINGRTVKLRGLRWPVLASGRPWGEDNRVLAPILDSKNNKVETNLT